MKEGVIGTESQGWVETPGIQWGLEGEDPRWVTPWWGTPINRSQYTQQQLTIERSERKRGKSYRGILISPHFAFQIRQSPSSYNVTTMKKFNVGVKRYSKLSKLALYETPSHCIYFIFLRPDRPKAHMHKCTYRHTLLHPRVQVLHCDSGEIFHYYLFPYI